jgi:hypothetical protein
VPYAARNSDDADLETQIFVLRVPGDAATAELEHVNAGTLTQHATLQEVFGRISAIVDPDNSRDRRH